MMTMTQPKPNFKRGDVVLVSFPNSDLITAKTRPAIIVQADNLQTGLPQIIIAMITSQMFRAQQFSLWKFCLNLATAIAIIVNSVN